MRFLKNKLHTLTTLACAVFNANVLYTLSFYLSILIFIIGFNFTDSPTPFGWYQQFMPNGIPAVSDVFFLDSMTGWASTGTNNGPGHINNILKTTNGGDNWSIIFTDTSFFSKVKFINSNTGFASGGSGGGTGYLYKSINSGINWTRIGSPGTGENEDMAVLNQDTLWVVDHDALVGGVYYTSNGGVSWTRQFYQGGANPAHIYMYNARIGFIDAGNLTKTTDGGNSWTPIPGAGNFFDMYFKDSLTGWKANADMKKTTDGGLTWIQQTLPSGGNIIGHTIAKITRFGNDSLWGANGGEILWRGTLDRDMLYRTTNGGQNWLLQVPDTSMPYRNLSYIQFINKLNGWSYALMPLGVHTITGGDTIFLTSIKDIKNLIPNDYILYQNYPNPFNPKTIINYEISRGIGTSGITNYIKLKIYDVRGKEIMTLADKKQISGKYEVTFDGSNFSSGVYFYSLYVDGNLIDTKKMILMK